MRIYCTKEGRWLPSAKGLEEPDACRFEIPTNKPDLIEWLNFHGFNPHHPAPDPPLPAPVRVEDQSYAVQSVLADTAFQALPLGQQLSLAMLAIEQAYKIVKAAGGS